MKTTSVEFPAGAVEELRMIAPNLGDRLLELSVCVDECSTTAAEQAQRVLEILASATINGEPLLALEEGGRDEQEGGVLTFLTAEALCDQTEGEVIRVNQAIPLGPGDSGENGGPKSSSGLVRSSTWQRLDAKKGKLCDVANELNSKGQNEFALELFRIYWDLGEVLDSRRLPLPDHWGESE